MKLTLLCCSAILAIHHPQNAAAPIHLTSPNGKLVLGLKLAPGGGTCVILEKSTAH